MRRVAVLLLALRAIPAVMQAQVCVGQAPWSSGALKVGGALEFGDGITGACSTPGVDCSGSDFVGELAGGAGIIFNNRISLVPALVIPIKSGSDLRFRIGLTVATGRKGG